MDNDEREKLKQEIESWYPKEKILCKFIFEDNSSTEFETRNFSKMKILSLQLDSISESSITNIIREALK